MKIEEELKRQKEEEERKRKQELDDIELARKLQVSCPRDIFQESINRR